MKRLAALFIAAVVFITIGACVNGQASGGEMIENNENTGIVTSL